jgi:PAS domain S-box-containing protein
MSSTSERDRVSGSPAGLLDGLGLPAVVANLEGVIEECNHAGARLYESDPAELLGRPLATGPLAANEVVGMEIVRESIANGGWQGELQLQRADELSVPAEVRATLLFDDEDRPTDVLVVFVDAHGRLDAERRAARIGSKLRLAQRVPGLGSWEWDPRADRLLASEAFPILPGLQRSAVVRMRDALGVMPPEDRERMEAMIDRALFGGCDSFALEYRVRGGDGRLRWLEAQCEVTRDGDGEVTRICAVTQDVSARIELREQLRIAEDFWRAAIDSLVPGVAVLDSNGAIIAVNEPWRCLTQSAGADYLGADYVAACEASGIPLAERAADGLRAVVSGQSEQCELEYRDLSSLESRSFFVRVTRYAGAGSPRVVVSHQDITDRQQDRERAALARDYLRAVTDSMGEGMFTLDAAGRFTYMNQTAQEQLGWSLDAVRGKGLHEIAHNRRTDGSPLPIEECPILGARRDGEAVRVEDDIFLCADGAALPVSYTASAFSTDAGIAGCVVVFRDITTLKSEARRVEHQLQSLAWVRRIRDALTENRFVLYAQPIIDLASGSTVQRELLLRMLSPDGSGDVITPGEFLPVAEEYGFITELDRLVIDRSFEIAATGLAVELNVSAASIADRALIPHITSAMKRTGADPTKIVFEITETALLSDESEGRRFVEHLHELGCRVAMDDFGTGYGGFTYLKQLPIDYLKIDIEFVRDLPDNVASRNVVQAIVNLARDFGAKTVAEGVEDGRTIDLLHDLGVDYAQGFFIGRPAPLDVPTLAAG